MRYALAFVWFYLVLTAAIQSSDASPNNTKKHVESIPAGSSGYLDLVKESVKTAARDNESINSVRLFIRPDGTIGACKILNGMGEEQISSEVLLVLMQPGRFPPLKRELLGEITDPGSRLGLAVEVTLKPQLRIHKLKLDPRKLKIPTEGRYVGDSPHLAFPSISTQAPRTIDSIRRIEFELLEKAEPDNGRNWTPKS